MVHCGLEALSRGAKKTIFCDKSYKATEILKKNIEKTHQETKSTIITKDYLNALESLNNQKFDLIFLDPPYKLNLVGTAVKKILELNLLSNDGIIVIETDEKKRDLEHLKELNINIFDIRTYGRVTLILIKKGDTREE